MTMKDRSERLAAGKDMIRSAGALALDHFRRYDTLSVHSKVWPQDLVSVADTSVETYIRQSIAARFPADGVVGEEHGQALGTSRFEWVIDPIDGTSCFLYGLPTWCAVLCLLEDGQPVLGLTYDACNDELYWASKGQGAFRNETAIFVNRRANIADGLTAIGGSQRTYSARVGGIIERMLASGGSFMRNGSTALTLAQVAAGHYVGYFQPLLHSWDCLAGLLLVSEAGGIVNDFLSGAGLHGEGDVFAAAPQVADELASIVGVDLREAAGGQPSAAEANA